MSDKPIPHLLRLKDNHPVMVKLMKLYDFAEQLGLSISFSHNGAIVEDRDWHGPMLKMYDIEDGANSGVDEWPPATEFKVIYENPAWLAEEKRKAKEYLEQQEAEERKRSAAAKKAAITRAENERQIREAHDRQELARLKALYPE